MAIPPASPCLLLTATIRVKDGMVFTARKDTGTRLEDYKRAFALWLRHPGIHAIVFVENSGSDLSELAEIARGVPGKPVEFLSFTAPEFDGALGKGVGEMLCLEYAVEHSRLLAQSPRLLKATGRYFLANTAAVLRWIDSRPDADILCDLLLNLTWADSRVFASTPEFLRRYLFPLRDHLNDSQGSNFEHVLARAVHAGMADAAIWAQPPIPLEIEGVSGSQGRNWRMGLADKLRQRLRHRLFARFLATGPQ